VLNMAFARRRKLAAKSLLHILCNLVTHVGISLQPLTIHSCQHQHVGVDVVIDVDHSFSVMQPVQSPDILLKSSLP